jgi:hypothetical protein
MDLEDPVIAALYPYSRPEDKNEDGYRYNLLPYEPQYGGHTQQVHSQRERMS